ncbi:hypothetical protein [Planococcus liqunii]|uniref:hypothetical protein n=1 Tax=Planococcus liqunii TaxID=3058394 RepID=UPI00265A7EA1|nr:hypothetical protein [Planococcus sp. N064]
MSPLKNFKLILKWKVIDLWGEKAEEISDKEKEYMDRIPTQNPYGFKGMIFGGIAFAFGTQY